MSNTKNLLLSRPRSSMAVLLAAAAAVVLLLAFQGSTARAEIEEVDATCIAQRVCVWSGTNFNGEELNAGCGGGTAFLGLEEKSVKNNCSVNVRIGWEEGGVTNWKACMAPGTQHGEPGRFNRVLPSGC
jgi:hypothetical protein